MQNFERRGFLKTTAAAGLGATILPSDILSGENESSVTKPPARPRVAKKVIVAGAGIAGLCCGYELMKRGHEVVVLDASGRHGGHVFTAKEGLSDGLYADYGAEHITNPGYERYWEYTREFNLTVLPYPRRKNIVRRIDGEFYTEEMLSDPAVLKKFGFNEREVKYLSEQPWWNLQSLYIGPYLDKFTDEYQPFGVGYDHLDNTSITEIYKKDGASDTALKFLGGEKTSALFELWRTGILHLRGVPLFPTDVHRLKGGNQELPNAFAKRLGDRVKLSCPITAIRHGETGVTVTYNEFGEEKEMSADFLANCIPLPAFRKIPVSPAFSPEKQYVIDNIAYDSYARLVFQARTKFWEEDGLSINMELNHPDIESIWQVANEVDSSRVALMGTCPGGVSAQRALAAFREIYPGKQVTIEQAMIKDWTKDQFAPTCERLNFPMNTLTKFWPYVMTPQGRIHFAGAYADNLNWGMEASTRSANRVAEEIDQA
uniref:FAD-dependent oxidoreductase n=1 Tax=Roseihalotalea indica TaxID=2867963 RepID=A0AA49JFL3_9BACT|nr:FAD-dependent oxidoreductase [Tunicatimonas sp. TK19036]